MRPLDETSDPADTDAAQAPSTATLVVDRLEAAALVSACLTIFTDLIHRDGRDLFTRLPRPCEHEFPDAARPLFSAYTKLCALSNHKVDLRILRVASRTWGGWEAQ